MEGKYRPLEVERRDHVLKALGALVSGLHVPRSLGSIEVPSAYDDVRDLIGDFGWSRPEEVTTLLRRVLFPDES